MHRHYLAASFLLLFGNSALAGQIEDATFHSAALNAPLPVNIYRPDGVPPENGWPVLYLLHGHDGDQNSWRDLGNIEKTLDTLIAAGAIRPLVVVMPGVKNSWYVDSAAVGGPGDYETALTGDLRHQIEKTLPVRKDRQGRAIAGLSMGGFGALHLAYGHEDLYGAVASLSGAIWQNVPVSDLDKTPAELKLIQDSAFFHQVDRTTITSGIVLPSTGDHFSGAFGTPFDARLFNEKNVFTLVAQHVAENEDLPATYLTVGDDDGFFLWRGAIALHETLQADKRKSELRVTDGDHVWSVWKVSIIDALKFIDGEWDKAADIAGD
ncbi:alpha/beta hydrolase [Agrobacterium salinitolerans]|uniref:Alpha/beta hydrolase family protein n=1 Tax=Agrobacterium salinitolerans TaxID=1183413 RepID=A0A9X3KPC2_9HYPH|nr:alpha/beta hydrolase family protein [Agrobacterium salinitolerans]MCZ7938465.1 alpha/beta hydrolase family protein [Agrobacterium salinitolerans]